MARPARSRQTPERRALVVADVRAEVAGWRAQLEAVWPVCLAAEAEGGQFNERVSTVEDAGVIAGAIGEVGLERLAQPPFAHSVEVTNDGAHPGNWRGHVLNLGQNPQDGVLGMQRGGKPGRWWEGVSVKVGGRRQGRG